MIVAPPLTFVAALLATHMRVNMRACHKALPLLIVSCTVIVIVDTDSSNVVPAQIESNNTGMKTSDI